MEKPKPSSIIIENSGKTNLDFEKGKSLETFWIKEGKKEGKKSSLRQILKKVHLARLLSLPNVGTYLPFHMRKLKKKKRFK